MQEVYTFALGYFGIICGGAVICAVIVIYLAEALALVSSKE